MITSKANPKIKQARSLSQRKAREASGLFLVEGIAQVGAAIEGGATVESILYAPDLLKSDFGNDLLKRAIARHIPAEAVEPEVFDSIASKEHPSGLIAIVRQPTTALEALPREPRTWYVALVAPQDPGNVGTVLRTIDAVGASGLIVLEGGVDAFHPTAMRASLGALFYKPVATATFDGFTKWARQNQYAIVGTSAKGTADYQAAEYTWPLVLLMGNEQKGFTPEQRADCEC